MISSGALPNVTLSRPPIPGPERWASSSVALPINAAVGTTPSTEAPNTTTAEALAASSATATGMNGTSRYGQPSPLVRKRRRENGARAEVTERRRLVHRRDENQVRRLPGEQGGALLGLRRVAVALAHAL